MDEVAEAANKPPVGAGAVCEDAPNKPPVGADAFCDEAPNKPPVGAAVLAPVVFELPKPNAGLEPPVELLEPPKLKAPPLPLLALLPKIFPDGSIIKNN